MLYMCVYERKRKNHDLPSSSFFLASNEACSAFIISLTSMDLTFDTLFWKPRDADKAEKGDFSIILKKN